MLISHGHSTVDTVPGISFMCTQEQIQLGNPDHSA
jgi:hypothetical protein